MSQADFLMEDLPGEKSEVKTIYPILNVLTKVSS